MASNSTSTPQQKQRSSACSTEFNTSKTLQERPSPVSKAVGKKTKGKDKKKSPKKQRKGRSGAPNYSKPDIQALLDTVQQLESIGNKMWAVVEKNYNTICIANERPPRDQDPLKDKFDKLCNAKKPTGDPSCPEEVRRAKHIARDIQGTIAAKLLEDKPDDGEGSDEEDEDAGDKGEQNCIGASEKKRSIGQGGLHAKRQKTEEVLVNSVESMTEFMGVIANSFISPKACDGTTDKNEAILASVVRKEAKAWKEEVSKSMEDTKEVIDRMRNALYEILGKIPDSSSAKKS